MGPPTEHRRMLPDLIRPMLATAGTLPPETEDERWAYEMKWDGVRAVVYAGDGNLRVMTRNDREVSGTYAELRDLGETLRRHLCVLDGEIVAFDAAGRADFATLQNRMHVTNAAQVRRLIEHVPVTYLVFDLLHLDGHSTVNLPYRDRRELLSSLQLAGPRWQTPPYFPGLGAASLQASQDAGLEGIVAKRLDSRYEPGRRSRAWIKVKTTRTQEVVVGGWKPGSGRREGGVGSLLLGVYAEGGLQYVGKVGTGFTHAMLADLGRMMKPLARRTSPFADEVPPVEARDAHWVDPQLVGEVVFSEWTKDGRLRVASWRGLRPDKRPDEVVREA